MNSGHLEEQTVSVQPLSHLSSLGYLSCPSLCFTPEKHFKNQVLRCGLRRDHDWPSLCCRGLWVPRVLDRGSMKLLTAWRAFGSQPQPMIGPARTELTSLRIPELKAGTWCSCNASSIQQQVVRDPKRSSPPIVIPPTLLEPTMF